jgi:MFS family permease
MLARISPLGERARGNRWGLTAGAYATASVAAAVLLGSLLGGAIAPFAGSPSARLVVLAAAALAAGAIDLAAPARLPTLHRQVDEDWVSRYRGWVYGAGFGAQLGVGVITVVTTASVYAWLVGAAVSGSALAGGMVGAAFGAARAAPLLAVRRADSPPALRRVLARLAAWADAGHLVAAGACVAIGVGASWGWGLL